MYGAKIVLGLLRPLYVPFSVQGSGFPIQLKSFRHKLVLQGFSKLLISSWHLASQSNLGVNYFSQQARLKVS
jgi:hypothetical protein